MNYLKYLLLSSLFFSCNQKDYKFYKSNEYPSDYLIIKMKTKALKKTNFTLFFREEKKNEFSENKSISKDINNDKGFQEVVFKINNKDVKSIRIDFGPNEQLDQISINSIELYLNNKKFVITEIQEFFTPNIFMKKKNNNTYELRILRDKIYDVYDPYMDSNKNFVKLLKQFKSDG